MLREGDPTQQPRRGDICKINLTGKLEDGTVVEDLRDFTVQVGDVEVTQGVDMALPLMKVGELARVTADPRFAYGTIGLKNEMDEEKSIPSGSLVRLFLIGISEERRMSMRVVADHLRSGAAVMQRRRRPGESALRDETESRVSRQLRIRGLKRSDCFLLGLCSDRKRERGNFWYLRSEFNLAIQLYRRSLEYLDDTDKYVGDAAKEEVSEWQGNRSRWTMFEQCVSREFSSQMTSCKSCWKRGSKSTTI